MEIKNNLQKSELDGFVAFNGCLDKCKAIYTVKEWQITCEGGDVYEETFSSWIERLQKMMEEYS